MLLVGIVIVENGQRRIPVQFAKRVVGRRMYGGQSTYIPLKVNQAGIVPIIFASSMLYLPLLITQVLPSDPGSWGVGVQRWVNDNLVQPDSFFYIVVYGFLIVGFAYFYTAIAFDPHQQADTIRKQGGFIPGIRPGPQTERYLAKILARITLPGALFIAAIALLPSLLLAFAERAGVRVRRHVDPHRRGRGPRDDEADRQPADDAELRRLPAVTRGVRMVMLGRQGAGKGTQCVRMSRHYVVPHISTGDMLRAAVREGTPLGRKAGEIMAVGGLVPDDLMIDIVDDRLDRDDTTSRGYVLDGFPRTVGQAEALAEITASRPLDVVIDLDVAREVVLQRLASRRVCDDCQANYSLDAPPKYGWVCDDCGGDVVQRDDDTPAAIEMRLAEYEANTAPLIEWYGERGLLEVIDGWARTDEVTQRLFSVIDMRRSS